MSKKYSIQHLLLGRLWGSAPSHPVDGNRCGHNLIECNSLISIKIKYSLTACHGNLTLRIYCVKFKEPVLKTLVQVFTAACWCWELPGSGPSEKGVPPSRRVAGPREGTAGHVAENGAVLSIRQGLWASQHTWGMGSGRPLPSTPATPAHTL